MKKEAKEKEKAWHQYNYSLAQLNLNFKIGSIPMLSFADTR